MYLSRSLAALVWELDYSAVTPDLLVSDARAVEMDSTSVGTWDFPLTSCLVNFELGECHFGKSLIATVEPKACWASRCKYPCNLLAGQRNELQDEWIDNFIHFETQMQFVRSAM